MSNLRGDGDGGNKGISNEYLMCTSVLVAELPIVRLFYVNDGELRLIIVRN